MLPVFSIIFCYHYIQDFFCCQYFHDFFAASIFTNFPTKNCYQYLQEFFAASIFNMPTIIHTLELSKHQQTKCPSLRLPDEGYISQKKMGMKVLMRRCKYSKYNGDVYIVYIHLSSRAKAELYIFS